jgi:hypothetical protein
MGFSSTRETADKNLSGVGLRNSLFTRELLGQTANVKDDESISLYDRGLHLGIRTEMLRRLAVRLRDGCGGQVLLRTTQLTPRIDVRTRGGL